jgi:hypothetical protein
LQELASNTLPTFVITAVRVVLKGGFQSDLYIRQCSIV